MRSSRYVESALLAHEKGYRVTELGVLRTPKGYVIKGYRKNGYLCFTVRKGRERRVVKAHQLQAYQKFGVAALAHEVHVRHLDGNCLNNALDNIGIGSPADNNWDIPEETRRRKAIRAASFRRKLDQGKYVLFMQDRASGMTLKDLARKYSLSKATASLIVRGITYRDYYKKLKPTRPDGRVPHS